MAEKLILSFEDEELRDAFVSEFFDSGEVEVVKNAMELEGTGPLVLDYDVASFTLNVYHGPEK